MTVGDTRLTLSWTAPTGTLTGYEVYYTSAPASGTGAVANGVDPTGTDPASSWIQATDTLTGSSTEFTFTGLTNGVTYRVRVRAQDTDGNGAYAFGSGMATRPVLTFDEASTSLRENHSSGSYSFGIDASPTLSVATSVNILVDPASTASSDEYSVPATQSLAADVDSASLVNVDFNDDSVNEPHETVILNLEAITSARYTLGTQKTFTLTIEDDDPPAAPSGLSVSAGYESLKASWSKPAGPVGGYELRYKQTSAADQPAATAGDPSTGWVTSTPSGTGTSASLTGLTAGTAYHVQVRANDGQTEAGNGWGHWSAAQTGTPRGVPDAPANLDVGDGDRRLLLTWTAPSGGTLTGYDVHYTSAAAGTVTNAAAASGSDPSAAWVAVSRTGTTASQTISDLTNGTAYRVRVRATNANGDGDWAFGTGTATTPVVSFGDFILEVTEGASTGPTTLNIDPVLATASSVILRVKFGDPADETSIDPEDVTGLPRTVVLPADTASVTVDLAQNIVDDSVNEIDGNPLILEAIADAPYSLSVKVIPLFIVDNDLPAAPSGLSVSGGYRTLTATWNGPVGPVDQYEVRFKEASAPDEAAYQNYPHTGWVTWSDTVPGFERDAGSRKIYLPTVSTKIEGSFGDGDSKIELRNGTAYHVQVRANDGQSGAGNGWGPWSATAEGTPDGSGPYRLTPDPDLLTGLTINDGVRDLRIESNVQNAVGFGGPNPIYAVQVSPGVRSVTVTPTWTNTNISGVIGEVRHINYRQDGSGVPWTTNDSENGVGKTVSLMPSGRLNSHGTTRLTLTVVGVDATPYRILIQHNTAWKSANDRLGRLELEIGQ